MAEISRLNVGKGADARTVAMLARPGAAPGLFWLSGFGSQMTATKATAIDAFGADKGLAVTRFDYSGNGQSDGAFADGTISRWLEEARAVFATTAGPQIVIGSSMGGWLALLLNRALRAAGEDRIGAMVLIAPAVDMTERLVRENLTPAQLHDLHARGRIEIPSEYADGPTLITEKLVLDGATHGLMGEGAIETGCPLAILQGGRDTDVPPEHTLDLLTHLTRDPVTFTLIPDGDHRLSRPQDIEKLVQTVAGLVAEGA